MSTDQPGDSLPDLAEKVTRSVLGTIEAERQAAENRESANALVRGLTFGWEHLTRIILAVGLILLAVALVVHGVSPTSILGKIVADYKEAQDRGQLVSGHIKLGNEFFNIDELEAAGAEFEEALQLEPTNPDAQRGGFKVRLFESISQHDYDPAVAERRLRFLLDEDRDDPAAHAFLADIYLVRFDFANALKEYDTALTKNPSFAHAYLGKGNVFDLQDMADDALKMYRRAARLAPSNQLYLNNVAYQLFRLGRYREALTRYTELLQLDARVMLPYYVAANAYRLLGDLETARRYQQTVVKLLTDKQARDLRRNKTPWFFHTAESRATTSRGSVTFLTDYRTKTYYARVSLALTSYLRGDERGARDELARARRLALDPDQRAAVRQIILFDVALLGKVRKELAGPAEQFARTVLLH
jgi:tetratricopeptide (TPR) repeat protein